MSPNTVLGSGATVVPWGKKYRKPLMTMAFWLFWVGFPLAYLGGINNNNLFMNLSYLAFTIACIVPLVTKK
jgi:hypothetical protein